MNRLNRAVDFLLESVMIAVGLLLVIGGSVGGLVLCAVAFQMLPPFTAIFSIFIITVVGITFVRLGIITLE